LRAERYPLPGAQSHPGWPYLESHAFCVLQISHDLKQIPGRRISIWTKHLVKGLGMNLCIRRQLRKADRSIDVVAQQLSAQCNFAAKKTLYGLAEKPLPKGGVASRSCLHCFSEVSRQSHALLLLLLFLPALVVFPSINRQLDVVLLSLFASATKKNDELLSLFSKIDTVSGPEVDPAS
jgi:hypothetical protein